MHNYREVKFTVLNHTMAYRFVLCVEKYSADQEVAAAYIDEFGMLVGAENLRHEQVYTLDERSLFWKCKL